MPDSCLLGIHLTQITDRNDSRRQQERQKRRADGKKQSSHAPKESPTRFLHLPIPRSSKSSPRLSVVGDTEARLATATEDKDANAGRQAQNISPVAKNSILRVSVTIDRTIGCRKTPHEVQQFDSRLSCPCRGNNLGVRREIRLP